jgi:hypothetical protein
MENKALANDAQQTSSIQQRPTAKQHQYNTRHCCRCLQGRDIFMDMSVVWEWRLQCAVCAVVE